MMESLVHRLFPGFGGGNATTKHASESPKPVGAMLASEDDADGWVVLGDAREAAKATTDAARRRSYADVVTNRS